MAKMHVESIASFILIFTPLKERFNHELQFKTKFLYGPITNIAILLVHSQTMFK